MPRTALLFAIVLTIGLQAQTAQTPAPAQPAQPQTSQPAPASPTPSQPAQPPPAPQTPAPVAPAMQTPQLPAPPVRVTDPDRDTELMLLDRVQKLANDALAGESKSGKVLVDRATLNEIVAAASQVKTALQR